jgi:uncharacterized membrane protein
MSDQATRTVCQICKQEKSHEDTLPAAAIREAIADTIRKRHPDWSPQGDICYECLNIARTQHVEDMLSDEQGELTALQIDVVESLKKEELVTHDLNREFETKLTVGQRVADKIAEFGGSWSFIITFFAVLFSWIIINTVHLLASPFDPPPYILLNLVLSCMAGIQAPVIMMSQNRQESKDRLRAEHDYRINLKAELEIRNLHQKLDHLLTHQWQRLAEIQEVQMELMDEFRGRKAG